MVALPLFEQATGEQVTIEDAIRYNVVALGLPDTPGALLFSTEEAFYSWGEKSRYAKELTQDRRRIRELQALDEVGRSEHLRHRTDIQRRVQSQLESLSISTGLPMDSEDLLRKAMQNPGIRQLTTDPISLYRGEGFTGGNHTLWGDHPDFSAFGFNNITSSIKLFISPFGTLFQSPWYKGRRLVMFCVTIGGPPLPWFEAPRLSDVGFDNMASSYAQIAVLF
jgi:hypothetical protein